MNFTGTILVVDDEAHIRMFVSLLLRQICTPTIIEASNGEAALVEYAAHKPDLVLLDVNMPGMDGLQTLRRLMEEDPDCLVVMLTSLVSRATVEEAASLGAVNYIRKDNTPEEVTRVLREILEECFGDEEGEPAAEAGADKEDDEG